jgi:ribosomal protein RSM22 (predicted rRNA methylase)
MPSITISKSAFTTLENLIAPGGRTRLSPFIEAAQLFVLTGQWIDEKKRAESTARIISDKDSLWKRLAQIYPRTKGHFQQKDYDEQDYRKMYLAYYFPVNVAKLQLLFLDLLRRGELDSHIQMIDFGVGTAVTCVALFDFLVALGNACLLHDEVIPIDEVSFLGLDQKKNLLRSSKVVVKAYIQTLKHRIEQTHDHQNNAGSIQWLNKIVTWAENSEWDQVLPDSTEIKSPFKPNYFVMSYVFNEIAKQNEAAALEERLNSLPSECMVLLVDPGDQQSSFKLTAWRERFLTKNPDFTSLYKYVSDPA